MIKTVSLDILWWLWIPVLALVAQILIECFAPHNTLDILHSETGPHELFQFVIIFIALLISLRGLMGIHWQTQKWLGAWFALAGLCCFYVAGEEISWGQHTFDWATSDYWLEVNDQGETNLHNTSSWLDQKPRLILELGIYVGGIILPLLARFKPAWLPARFAIIYPSPQLFVTALLVLGPKMVDVAGEVFIGHPIFTRVSEVQEIYMFYFVALYLWVLKDTNISKV